jgi:hypothetical protein
MASAAPSCTSCADSNTIGGLRSHYQRIVFGTTRGHLTLRTPYGPHAVTADSNGASMLCLYTIDTCRRSGTFALRGHDWKALPSR